MIAVKRIYSWKLVRSPDSQPSCRWSTLTNRLTSSWSKARTQFVRQINTEIKAIQDAGTYKRERIITSRQLMEISVEGQSRPLINFCANNYLGLSADPRLIQAGKDALEDFGAGLSSVRFICGTQSVHRELERKIAAFHEREDAILYGSCFDANAGIFEVITGPNDAIISDELNHASIIDGIRLSKARRLLYKHMDVEDLQRQLFQAKDCRRRLIVTDGVFSMDGDVAPLAAILDVAEQYNALVMVDDCHATGFVGPRGRGVEEAIGRMGAVDILNSTLGKALGGAMGGYTTGPRQLIKLLRQRSRPSLFSNSLAPGAVGPALKALDLLMVGDNAYVGALRDNVTRFRTRMREVGFTLLGDAAHPICPVLVGDAKLASEIADGMLDERIYVIGFNYPVVPKEKARIRVQISAAHTEAQIDECVAAFIKVGRRFGVI